jgi:hypothetical protein
MSIRLLIAAAAAFVATVSSSHASTVTVDGSYTAVDGASTNAAYDPTINNDGQAFLSSPFSEVLTVGSTTTPSPFLQVAPVSGGSGVGTVSGVINIAMTLTDAANSPVTSFSYTTGGNSVTLTNGVLNIVANYNIFYGNQTDCITFSTTTCVANDVTNVIGETITATLADGTTISLNLYNWADWNMAPNISIDPTSGPTPQQPTPTPEPASLALFGAGLIGLFAALRRARGGSRAAGRAAA